MIDTELAHDVGFGGKSRGRGGRESRPVLGKVGIETRSFERSISFNFASSAAILPSVLQYVRFTSKVGLFQPTLLVHGATLEEKEWSLYFYLCRAFLTIFPLFEVPGRTEVRLSRRDDRAQPYFTCVTNRNFPSADKPPITCRDGFFGVLQPSIR